MDDQASILQIIGAIVGTVGPVGVFALAALWVWNKSQSNKRKAVEAGDDPAVTRGMAGFLAEKVADVDRHTKDGFRETLGGLNAIAHGVDKLSEQTARLDRVWGEELRGLRHEIEKLPEQIELRIQAARSRHGD